MATQTAKPSQPAKRGKKAAASSDSGGKNGKKAPAKPVGGPWLTRAEAAQYIGLATKTLDNWRACLDPRRPMAHRIGGKILYRQDELDAWIERQQELSTIGFRHRRGRH